MDIRDQMTASVRLTKRSAEMLNAFLAGISIKPKNMNDALNMALSHLPTATMIEELSELQRDPATSIKSIKHRFDTTGFLKRSDYYFLIRIAKNAVELNKKERIEHKMLAGILMLTKDLWDLCKVDDRDGHHERYMLGNIGGGSSTSDPQSLSSYIPVYIERTKQHPFPSTLEFALRNPEVMLRDHLEKVDEMNINRAASKYFPTLYRMALRWYYLKNGYPLERAEEVPFNTRVSKTFGRERRLHFMQFENENVGFSILIPGDHSISIAANNIIEVEEYTRAFSSLTEQSPAYKGEKFALTMLVNGVNGKTIYGFQTPSFRFSMYDDDYQDIVLGLEDMKENPGVLSAIETAHMRFGEI